MFVHLLCNSVEFAVCYYEFAFRTFECEDVEFHIFSVEGAVAAKLAGLLDGGAAVLLVAEEVVVDELLVFQVTVGCVAFEL